MSSALWMLLGLQLKSFFRFFLNSLKTVKGALLAGVGLLVFLPWVIAVLFGTNRSEAVDPELLRTNGPLILLGFCLMQVLLSASESTIYFSPAEVQFLFSGPFTRRQILLYKITLLTLLTLPMPLLFALLFQHHAGNWFSALIAINVGILFLNLFTLALNLIVDSLGSTIYNRARSVGGFAILAGVVALIVTGVVTDWGQVGRQVTRLGEMSVVRAITWPLSWFFELFLANSVGAFLLALVAALLVNLVLLLIVFALDRNLLELAAGNSVRIYERIQQMRRGQTALTVGGGSATWSLPEFPFWGGVGPLFWRQSLQALRGLGRLAVTLAIIGGILMFMLARGDDVSGGPGGPGGGGMRILGSGIGILIWLTVFLTLLMPFDFRGDIDRMSLLKSLPTPSWALVIGQLLTPVVMTSLFHWAVLVGLWGIALQQGETIPVVYILALALLFPPFNFVMFAIENLLFLLFPMRLTQNTPGDFQSVGRNVLLTLGKMLMLGLMVGGASVAGYWTYITMGQNFYLAVGVVGMVLATCGAGLIPPIMLAFHSYDVGRDTPP